MIFNPLNELTEILRSPEDADAVNLILTNTPIVNGDSRLN